MLFGSGQNYNLSILSLGTRCPKINPASCLTHKYPGNLSPKPNQSVGGWIQDQRCDPGAAGLAANRSRLAKSFEQTDRDGPAFLDAMQNCCLLNWLSWDKCLWLLLNPSLD